MSDPIGRGVEGPPIGGGSEGPRIPPPVFPNNETGDRIAAQAEQFRLERAAADHYQDTTTRRIIAWGMWAVVIVVFAIIISAFLTLGYHLVMPSCLRWLSDDELREVRSAVLSGAVVGLGTTYLRRYLEERQ